MRKDENFYGFYMKRKVAEKIARRKCKVDDVTLRDVYKYYVGGKKEKNIAIALERKCEVALAFQNKALVEVLKKLKDLGTRIIITTDMYLDNSVLESILKNNSIPYDYLFVSGNIGMAKYTGRLFDHVVKSLNIDKNAFIHIGDTLEKDVIAAKKMGCNAICTQKRTI
ncbi:HAD hydrolase-like protein [Enterococcus faecium]|uniref:HAD family hydrolase n=2 Tax=Enterococcus faecium TaxID=1352 RepID=UPI00129C1F80|nr:HAD family hydrolase [Enterococcus faecium]MDK4377284.1 HAD hydrolase-like protein [Enterococcus faecium]MRI45704.1 hypothetical protein [Enterococcus faecium]